MRHPEVVAQPRLPVRHAGVRVAERDRSIMEIGLIRSVSEESDLIPAIVPLVEPQA